MYTCYFAYVLDALNDEISAFQASNI
uniref:Uncharacterized protein n=1 Tax=Rhizophora mucronata TaxID=61149 RepID=A0A2P2Q9M9_RHIMU